MLVKMANWHIPRHIFLGNSQQPHCWHPEIISSNLEEHNHSQDQDGSATCLIHCIDQRNQIHDTTMYPIYSYWFEHLCSMHGDLQGHTASYIQFHHLKSKATMFCNLSERSSWLRTTMVHIQLSWSLNTTSSSAPCSWQQCTRQLI